MIWMDTTWNTIVTYSQIFHFESKQMYLFPRAIFVEFPSQVSTPLPNRTLESANSATNGALGIASTAAQETT